MSSSLDLWCRQANRPSVVITSLLAGIALGVFAPVFSSEIGVLGDIYVDLLKMIILPFMISAIIFSLRRLFQEGGASEMIGRVAIFLLAAMFLSGVVGLLFVVLATPGGNLSFETMQTLGKLVGDDLSSGGHIEMALFGPEEVVKTQSFGSMVLGIIPGNIFTALSQGETLKSLIFAMLFGLAIGHLPAGASESLTQTLETIYSACQKLTQWFNCMLPVVLLSMVASQVSKTGLEPMRAMLGFLTTLSLASLAIVLLSLVSLRWASRLSWREVLRSQREPLAMAMATRSSPACMPVMIESLAERLCFPRSRVELLVPLGVALLRTGSVLYYVVATFFIAQLYGRDLQMAEIGVVLLGAILAGFASSGMTGFVTISLTGFVCAYIGLPFEAALALFVAIDPIADILRTLVNVATNNAFAALVSRR